MHGFSLKIIRAQRLRLMCSAFLKNKIGFWCQCWPSHEQPCNCQEHIATPNIYFGEETITKTSLLEKHSIPHAKSEPCIQRSIGRYCRPPSGRGGKYSEAGVGTVCWGLGNRALLTCWQHPQTGQLVVLLPQEAVMQLRQKTQDKWESGWLWLAQNLEQSSC